MESPGTVTGDEDDPTEASGTQRIGVEIQQSAVLGEDSTRLEKTRLGWMMGRRFDSVGEDSTRLGRDEANSTRLALQ